MIYGWLDPKSKRKKKSVGVFLSSCNKKYEYLTRGEKSLPKDASLLVSRGLLRGGSDFYKLAVKRNINYVYMDNSLLDSIKQNNIYRSNVRLSVNSFVPRYSEDCIYRQGKWNLDKWIGAKGNYILIAPPSFPTMDICDSHTWLEDTIKRIRKVTDRQIIVRKKPTDELRSSQEFSTNLESVIVNSYCFITYSSSLICDAVKHGIPVSSPKEGFNFGFEIEDIETDDINIEQDRIKFLNFILSHNMNHHDLKHGYAWNVVKHELKMLGNKK